MKSLLIDLIKKYLKESNIQFEVLNEDGKLYIFPKGAKLFDKKLVFDVLELLSGYPNSLK